MTKDQSENTNYIITADSPPWWRTPNADGEFCAICEKGEDKTLNKHKGCNNKDVSICTECEKTIAKLYNGNKPPAEYPLTQGHIVAYAEGAILMAHINNEVAKDKGFDSRGEMPAEAFFVICQLNAAERLGHARAYIRKQLKEYAARAGEKKESRV